MGLGPEEPRACPHPQGADSLSPRQTPWVLASRGSISHPEGGGGKGLGESAPESKVTASPAQPHGTWTE